MRTLSLEVKGDENEEIQRREARNTFSKEVCIKRLVLAVAQSYVKQRGENMRDNFEVFPKFSTTPQTKPAKNLEGKNSIENYVLIYEIKDEDRKINILRFRYARIDLTKLEIEK